HVEWSGGDPSEPAGSAELRLFFYTRGKGTRDVELVDLMVMHEPGISGRRAFAFNLPEGAPPSFSGRLVSVIWALEFHFDGEVTERFEFFVSPTGQEIDLYAHGGDDLPKYSDFSFGSSRKKKEKWGNRINRV
ncbi:MAG: hypothetical protein HKN23_12305, partial [Verrucomicrobiales bacterium]|nr:hypothetical protein [Verrucomicrobiales bacterium]